LLLRIAVEGRLSRAIFLAALALIFVILASAGSALAQSGSVGGTVGKHNKSLSGDLGEQTPPKSVSPPAGKPLPRTRTFFESHDKNDPCDSGTLFAACH